MNVRTWGSTALFVSASVLSSCADAPLPVAEPGPQPPAYVHPEPAPRLEVPPQIGDFAEVEAPRYGVSIFEFPRDTPANVATHSSEWTGRAVNQLDFNKVTAMTVTFSDPLTGEIAEATANLARGSEATGVDVLICGTVLPGGRAQVRLAAADTKTGAIIAKSQFEGGNAEEVLSTALAGILQKTGRYWFALERGTGTELVLDVVGLAPPSDILAIHSAVAALPGVYVSRREVHFLRGPSTVLRLRVFTRESTTELELRIAALVVETRPRKLRLAKDGPSSAAPEGVLYQATYE